MRRASGLIIAVVLGVEAHVQAEPKGSIDTELLEIVEEELKQEPTFAQRRSVTRRFVEVAFMAEARASLPALEGLAKAPGEIADAALLAAQAGDEERARALAEKADALLAKPVGLAEELAACDLAITFERLGDRDRAMKAFGRVRDDPQFCAAWITAEVAALGRIERAEAWAKRAERDPDVWLDVARAQAVAGKKKAARATLARAVRVAGTDEEKLAKAAAIHALLGDGRRATRLAAEVHERILAQATWGTADPLDLIRAFLAGGDAEGAASIAHRVRNMGETYDSLGALVSAASLYLELEAAGHPKGSELRAQAEALLGSVEKEMAASSPSKIDPTYHDGMYFGLARARVRTGHIARAIEHAASIADRTNRMGAYLVIAGHCRDASVARSADIDAALALARALTAP